MIESTSSYLNKNVLYKYELQIRVNVIQKMIEEGYDETKLQLIRAKYNLKIINQLFIILNFMINEDDYRKNISKRLYDPQINQNINIYKLNMSLFMINLIYEKTRDKIDAILMQPESKTETLIEDLLKEYNGDSQTLGEVLSSRYKDVRNSSEHNQYRIMREYLIEQGFDTTKTPIFKFLRNSSSHGEFYPIIRDNNDIDIKIDNDGKEKQVISLQTLITLVDSKLSTLPSAEEYQIFIDFYKSTDILETMEKCMSVLDTYKSSTYKPDILLLILQSIYQKRIIEISYLGSNALSVSERKIEAVGIFFSRTNWYLIGFYLPKEIYLTFRIDRIQKMHILNELQSREHPPLEKFIREFYDKEKLHEIVIRIEKNKTSIMNDDKYYYGLTSEKEIGDMFELHFLTFSISKFAHWYLSFADSATIIRPDSLKYEVKNIINNISI